jgi:hypothetical protein
MKAHHHTTNTAKPVVKSAKYHIISHIATKDTNCLIKLWGKMRRQIQDMLNMLRTLSNNNGAFT